MAEPGLTAADVALVHRSLKALGLPAASQVVEKLSVGASGSQVFSLELDGDRAVLKVTEDPGWRVRAERELAVYDELAGSLTDVLPEVLGSHRDAGAVRLLLATYEPFPAASTLDDSAWVALAGQLGRTQSVPVQAAEWLQARPWPQSEDVLAAVQLWNDRGSAVPAARGAARLAVVRDLPPLAGPVLTHGDCHVGNLLHGPGGRVLWADWQEACLSSGLDDLVFLWQRAEFDGAHPPREAMNAAYAAARSFSLDDAFRAAVEAAELRLLLVAWPHFLPYGRQERQQAMTQRLHRLTSDTSW